MAKPEWKILINFNKGAVGKQAVLKQGGSEPKQFAPSLFFLKREKDG